MGEPTLALGIDLASARWRDNGTALVAHDGTSWLACDSPALAWDGNDPPSAQALADQIDRFATMHGVDVICIDGPQGWRDPRRPPDEGVGRKCEREARTPGKTGPRGVTFPGNYVGWTSLSIELFALLRDGPHEVIECFPTSAWRSLGLTPLPAKAKRPRVDQWARELKARTGLPIPSGLEHDDLQAVIAALIGSCVHGGPLDAISRGVPAYEHDGALVEGLIWDVEVAGGSIAPAATTARPILVVVTGPPGAGKTTTAVTLRDRLGLPLVAKDGLKETLASQLGTQGRDASYELGVAVFHLMASIVHELLAHDVSLICEGNFVADSIVFRELPPTRIAQVHVSAPPDVLRARLLDRDPDRHPVHYDREAADEIVALAAEGKWDPVPLGGELIRVDGTRPLDVDELTRLIRRM